MTLRTVERLEDLPELAPDAEFVVVDVIITSTAIVRLLEEGAEYVRPFGDANAARAWKAETDRAMLVGEDGGMPVEGFDLSPLPSVFADHDLEGARVGIHTTNGTRAVERIGRDEGVYVGSTVNAAAVAEVLDDDRETWLVAAGRYSEPTPEDTAGVELIRAEYEGNADDALRSRLRDEVRGSDTAGWIRDLGYGNEIEAVADFDSSETVPRMRDGVFVADSR